MGQSTTVDGRILRFLSLGVILLVAANILNDLAGRPFWGITQFIYLGWDDNFSAWYSSMLLAVAGLLAYECWLHAREQAVRHGVILLLFAGLLFLMSADEVASFHEILGRYAARFLGLSSRDFAKHASWVWVGGPVVAGIFLGFMIASRKVLALVPRATALLSAGLLMILLGGVILESTINFLNHEELQWLWDVEIIVEEALEMAGTMLIAAALLVWRDGMRRTVSGSLEQAASSPS